MSWDFVKCLCTTPVSTRQRSLIVAMSDTLFTIVGVVYNILSCPIIINIITLDEQKKSSLLRYSSAVDPPRASVGGTFVARLIFNIILQLGR